MYSITLEVSFSKQLGVVTVFAKEADMAPVVAAWMRSAGLTVKTEFQVPWGICDLVGASFNRDHVSHRLRLRQRSAIGSITRAMILLDIPDVETRKTTSSHRIAERYAPVLPREQIELEIERLIAMRFVIRTQRGRLQKVNGWMPLEDRLVAIELKLARGLEVFRQARRHLEFASESFMAMPLAAAETIANDARRFGQVKASGVGLLGVTQTECRIIHDASARTAVRDAVLRLYCVEKFWRTRTTGN